MNTTYNPQAGAEQARIYRDAVTPNTPVPEAMRAMAEKVVDRSCEAYDRSKDALDASVVTFERVSTLPAKALWPSTANSSTSPSVT